MSSTGNAKCFVSERGYGILKSEMDSKELIHLKKELSVKPKTFGYGPNDGKDEFYVFLESSKKIYVPKMWGVFNYGKPHVVNLKKGDDIRCSFKGNLRKFQESPVKSFMKECKKVEDQGFAGGILHLPPGWGKTVMALYILCQLGTKTLVIVHKDFLLKQWKDRINEYVDNVSIGIIRGKELDIEGKDIVIGSLQSISMKPYDSKIFSSFGFVIMDECHHLGANVFSQALQKVNFQYSLGLSATVNRKDGLTKVFKWYLGDILYKGKNDNRNGDVEVELICIDSVDNKYCEEHQLYNSKPNVSKMINNICDYDERTLVISNKIAELYNSTEREIIVLSDRRNHLKEIKKKLTEMYNIEDVGYYVGGMKEHDLKKSESNRVILGTYNMISEGFDLPKLNTLILASPKSDIEQSIGRIQRQLACERKYVPMVIDIVDDFSVFSNQFIKRMKFYKKNGYKVEGIKGVEDNCEENLEENECLL